MKGERSLDLKLANPCSQQHYKNHTEATCAIYIMECHSVLKRKEAGEMPQKSANCSCRRPRLKSQHPVQQLNHLQVQLCGCWCPLLASAGHLNPCAHTNSQMVQNKSTWLKEKRTSLKLGGKGMLTYAIRWRKFKSSIPVTHRRIILPDSLYKVTLTANAQMTEWKVSGTGRNMWWGQSCSFWSQMMMVVAQYKRTLNYCTIHRNR